MFTHRNHYLFADYYLNHRVPQLREWQQTDARAVLDEMARLWRRFRASRGGAERTVSPRPGERGWGRGPICPRPPLALPQMRPRLA